MAETDLGRRGPVVLKLRWDGDSEDLKNHRLSITDFGEALLELNRALQRTAGDIVSNAGDTDPHELVPLKAETKRLLGLDLVAIEDGCVQLVFEVKTQPNSPYQGLPEHASQRLLNDITFETQGVPVNRGVRRFLKKVPSYVREQTYTVFHGDQSFASAHVEEMNLPDTPSPTGGLFRVPATVKGVIFSPPQVQLDLFNGGQRTCAATKELVHQSFELKERPIEAMLLYRSSKPQLMWIRDRRKEFPLPSEEEMDDALLKQWGDLLRSLPND